MACHSRVHLNPNFRASRLYMYIRTMVGISISRKIVFKTILGSGVVSGKMLLVRIIENNKNYAYFRSG